MATRGVDLAKLEKKKRASVGQLLFKCARLLNEQAMARVNREAGEPVIRASHTQLFPHIDFRGVRLSELARRIGVTKQAVGQLVAELADMGVVELCADPSDGRAKLVRFTPKGARAIEHGLGVLSELEQDLERKIGRRQMRALHRALLAAEAALES